MPVFKLLYAISIFPSFIEYIMDTYKITFDPELRIDAAEFADSWNTIPSCSEMAKAAIGEATQSDFNLSELTTMAVLTTLSTVTTLALSELVKHSIAEYFKKRQQSDNPPPPEPDSIEVREIEQPDGSKLVVVVVKK